MSDTSEQILFKKIDTVKEEVNQIRSSIAEILVRLDHLKESHTDEKTLLTYLECVVYGQHKELGILTRLELLEQTERFRQKLLLLSWAAIVGLILELMNRWLFSSTG